MEACNLAEKDCVPCKGGVPPLKGTDLQKWIARLNNEWKVVEEHHLTKAYSFPNFATALAFVNKVGALAEQVGHHPDITLSWGKVGVEIWTHKINGLTESDFIFAAKTDRFY